MKPSLLGALFRLTAMRRRTGASVPAALAWAAGLLWRDHQITRRHRHIERRAAVEHATRQRL
ncbi:hypothetical protein [Paracidovorax anthurii]|uniref:Uncharacterized protein n=1 Tax=Paracidovorax anthurii TaxID=78229 RepID=A0A328ZQA6_9BURK|nr:hypothetical protein [Paracidovorax anthurii]RAR85007.1 hypothetical protein AX018_1008100 [Paracidovorax anthurii]